MVLQLWAAGAATLLAVRDRFDRIAVAYIVGAVGGLVVYLAVSGPAGELSLGWSMFAMAVVTCALMLRRRPRQPRVRAKPPRGRWRWRACRAAAVLVLGRTAVYLAFNGLYVVTLAFATQLRRGRCDGPLLRLPLRQLPGRGHRLRARDVAHRRHAPRRARRLARGDRRHRAGRLPLLDDARRAGARRADRRRRAADRRGLPAQLRRRPGRPAARLRRAARRVDGRRRCWSTCCCRRCSRSAGPSSSTRWRCR